MDIISSAKNVGSSAFGSSSSGSSGSDGGGGGGGIFSSFTSLSIQKMALLLGIIAFIISVGTVAILLWKSKSTQKWPPEISKCPDRMDVSTDGLTCVDNYGLFTPAPGPQYSAADTTTPCTNFDVIKSATYTSTGFAGDNSYVPWEGVVDGKASRASSLKCTT